MALQTNICQNDIVLEVDNISKRYGDKHVLSSVALTVRKGETASIVGASGVGKTTLFHIVAGMARPDTGQILLCKDVVTGVKGKVGYMQQKDLLLPYKTVIDNVSLPLVIAGQKKDAARAKAAESFELFGLSGTEKLFPAALSGGMRQRAALLRTFLMNKEVLLLDEPFSALDAITRRIMRGWFSDIAKKLGLTTLLITHDIDEAIALSQRVIILKGSPATITAEVETRSPYSDVDDFILSSKFLEYKRRITKALLD